MMKLFSKKSRSGLTTYIRAGLGLVGKEMNPNNVDEFYHKRVAPVYKNFGKMGEARNGWKCWSANSANVEVSEWHE